MRSNSDEAKADGAEQQVDRKPYPSWADIMSRLRSDRVQPTGTGGATRGREWHDLVADMIIGR